MIADTVIMRPILRTWPVRGTGRTGPEADVIGHNACLVPLSVIDSVPSVALRSRLWVAFLAMAVLAVVGLHRVDRTDADARGTLLVSEALITHGTIRLDQYDDATLARDAGVLQQKGGHQYHYFPLGTPVLSVPFVAVARLAGLEMTRDERVTQTAIAAFVALLTFLMLTRLASRILDPVRAATVAGVFWMGTSLASTTSTALWSHDFAVLFAVIAIDAAVADRRDGAYRRWTIVAPALFLAYACRPTMALLAPFLILFVAADNRRAALRAGLLLSLLGGAFAAFSQHEFGQWLPDYYLPQRLGGDTFWLALYGNLASPSRGLLIYSPFILLVWLCRPAAVRDFGLGRAWLLIALGWPVAHLLVISRFPHWWAGASFGARLMTDALPGLFLLTLRAWPVTARTACTRAAIGVLVLSAAFSIYVNAYRGTFVEATAAWNHRPDIDQHPGLVFDWRYPQFMHNWRRHESRIAEYE